MPKEYVSKLDHCIKLFFFWLGKALCSNKQNWVLAIKIKIKSLKSPTWIVRLVFLNSSINIKNSIKTFITPVPLLILILRLV